MFCANCGKKIPDEGAYCPFCSSSLDRSQSTAPSVDSGETPDSRSVTEFKTGKKSGKAKIFAIMGVVAILAIVAVCGGIAHLRNRTYVMVKQTFLSGDSYMYIYDKDGLCLKKILTDSIGNQDCETYRYSNGILTEKSVFTANADLYRYEYVYDSHGNIISELSYDENGDCLSWIQYEYDEIGNRISETHVDPDGTVSYRNEYEYDKSGNPVKWMYYDFFEEFTDDPYMVITYENEYDFWGNLVCCTAWQSNGIINKQVNQYSYTAEYFPLSGYTSNKESLDAERRETHYLENKMVYTDGYIELVFSGLEATHNYLGTDDNFFEIDLEIVNNRNITIIISLESLKINSKNVTATDSLFLEPGDSGILRIFNRGFALDEAKDNVTDVVFTVKASDSVSKGANGTSWSYGPNTVLNLTETVYFDFPVLM